MYWVEVGYPISVSALVRELPLAGFCPFFVLNNNISIHYFFCINCR